MKKTPIRPIEFLILYLPVLLLLLIAGCDRNDLLGLHGSSRDDWMRENTPERQASLARNAAESLRRGRYDEVIRMLQPSVVGATTQKSLIEIHDTFAEREPMSIKVIDAQKAHDADAEIAEIVLDYELPAMTRTRSGSNAVAAAKWVFVKFTIRSKNPALDTIERIDVVTSDEPIEQINAFNFEDKGIAQYGAFVIAILLSVLTIYAAVVCIRSKIGPQKWLWLIFMLFTITVGSVNWTSGQWSFNKISFGFAVPPFPANLTVHSAYGPWSLTLGLPVGAISFLLYRRFRRASCI